MFYKVWHILNLLSDTLVLIKVQLSYKSQKFLTTNSESTCEATVHAFFSNYFSESYKKLLKYFVRPEQNQLRYIRKPTGAWPKLLLLTVMAVEFFMPSTANYLIQKSGFLI